MPFVIQQMALLFELISNKSHFMISKPKQFNYLCELINSP